MKGSTFPHDGWTISGILGAFAGGVWRRETGLAGAFCKVQLAFEDLSTHFDRRIRVGGFVPCRGGIANFYQRPNASSHPDEYSAPAAIYFDHVECRRWSPGNGYPGNR